MNILKTALGIAACLTLSRTVVAEPLVFKRELRSSSAVQPRAALSDLDGDGTDDFYVLYENGVRALSGRTGAILARYDGSGYLGWSVKSLPDMDGDGIFEVLASSPAKTVDGQDSRGMVFAFQGGSPSGEIEAIPPLYSRTCTLPRCAIGIGLGVTSDLALLPTEAGAVYVLDARTGVLRAAIRNMGEITFGHPAGGIGDVDGDGTEDFALGGLSCWIVSGAVSTAEEGVEVGQLGPHRLRTLAHAGVQFGTPSGYGDKDSFINLGDPTPEDDIRESLFVTTVFASFREAGIAAYSLKMGSSGLTSSLAGISLGSSTPLRALSLESVGDLNADGLDDLAVFDRATDSDWGRILIVNGRGLLDGVDGEDILQEIPRTSERFFYGGMEGLGDQDGDGFQELIVGGIDRGQAFFAIYTAIPEGGSLSDCNENGTPDLEDLIPNPIEMAPPFNHGVADGPQALAAADLNADGAADFVSANFFSKTVSVLLNDGAGDFEDSTDLDVADGPRDIVAADLDDDGALDLVTADLGTVIPSVGIEYGDTISILRNAGDGSFAPHESMTFDGPPLVLEAADWDGDFDPDLAVATTLSPGSIKILSNDGAGSFRVLPSLAVESARAMAAADLNGDKAMDLAVLDSNSGSLLRFKGRGNGAFDALPPVDVGNGPKAIDAADLNGDGKADLAFLTNNVYGINVLLNIGEGEFGERIQFDYGNAEPIAIVAADIDLDSDIDLVTSNTGSLDGVWVGINDGTGGFAKVHRFQLDGNVFDAATGDTDADDDPDIGVVNLQYDEIGVFENLTEPPTSRDCNGNGKPDECDIATASSEDCNRNGIPDSCDVAKGGRDRDRDGIPDECAPRPFHRGDSNDDGALDIGDAVTTLGYLFNGTAEPSCLETADHNNDGTLDISDPVATLMFLFASGPPPAVPGPPDLPCGIDPDASGSREDLGCLSYSGCDSGD